MKRHRLFFGSVGVATALGLGLYAYMNQRQLYQGSETKASETEGFQEEAQEYEPEHEMEDYASLPEEKAKEVPAQYNTSKVERKDKDTSKSQPDPIKYVQKSKTVQSPISKTSLPTSLPASKGLDSQGLDNIVEDEKDEEEEKKEKEEKPPYNLSPEERGGLTDQQLLKYGDEALNNLDYKAAEIYSSDLKKRHEAGTGTERSIFDECRISEAYDRDLSDMVRNCKKYDYDSVFRKVMWMDVFFIPKYEQSLLDCRISPDSMVSVPGNDSHYIEGIDPGLLVQKGNQALEAIKYCHE